MVKLVDVDDGNWRTPLKVAKAQEQYVANSTTILARAYAYRNSGSRACLICDDEIPVGMVLYHEDEESEAYIFSEMFIDEQFQGKGFGGKATELVLDCMRKDGKYEKVVLCYIDGNDAARHLYEKYGFVETDRDDDEIILMKELV